MYVRVHVTSGAKRERVTKHSETEFDILVREPRERNLANRRVTSIIATLYGVPVRAVRLIAGHRSPTKLFDIPVD